MFSREASYPLIPMTSLSMATSCGQSVPTREMAWDISQSNCNIPLPFMCLFVCAVTYFPTEIKALKESSVMEFAQWLRVLVAFVASSGLIVSTHVVVHNCL